MWPLGSLADFDGWILDWDNFLVSSMLDFSDLRSRWGIGTADVLEFAAGLPQERQEVFHAELQATEKALSDRSAALPGARELIDWLQIQGKAWCIVTRNREDTLRQAAAAAGLPLPEYVFTRDSAYFKPDERAFYQAASVLGTAPNRTAALGDYLYELLCARRAGMRAFLITDGVEREWGDPQISARWCDGRWPTLCAFMDDLLGGGCFMPWEYQDSPPSGETVILDGSRESWQQVESALVRGARLVEVEPLELDIERWRQAPWLSSRWLGRRLVDAAARQIKRRWPSVEVIER